MKLLPATKLQNLWDLKCSLTLSMGCQVRFCLQDWAEATSEFMKSLDPNHLLTLGAEGFLGPMTPGALL